MSATFTVTKGSVADYEQYGRVPFWNILTYDHSEIGEVDVSTVNMKPLIMLENMDYELPYKDTSNFWTYVLYIVIM